jgi:hypothetical protein
MQRLLNTLLLAIIFLASPGLGPDHAVEERFLKPENRALVGAPVDTLREDLEERSHAKLAVLFSVILVLKAPRKHPTGRPPEPCARASSGRRVVS